MKRYFADTENQMFINLFQPSKPILCSTKNDDGTDHIAPFSWINPVSYCPPMVAVSMSCKPKKPQSLINIERTGEFAVNYMQSEFADRLVYAAFPAEGENKFDRSGLTREKCAVIGVCAIAESCAFLECRVREICEFGDTNTIFADIVSATYDDEIFTPPKMLVNIKKYDPIFHLDSYEHQSGQLHVFMSAGKEYVADIPYPKSEEVVI